MARTSGFVGHFAHAGRTVSSPWNQRDARSAGACSTLRSRLVGQSSPWGRGLDRQSTRLVLAVPVQAADPAVHSALMRRGRPPQIVAYGGGGFSMEPGNPLLDEYVLGLCRRKKPKVCFFPSASGDADHYVVRFYRHFSSEICDPSHISLFRRDCGPGAGARAPAQAGPDLRRRRVDPVAARRLARARHRRGSARRLAGGCHPCRRVRRLALLVRRQV